MTLWQLMMSALTLQRVFFVSTRENDLNRGLPIEREMSELVGNHCYWSVSMLRFCRYKI